MKKPTFARPLLENLEDRLCPALDFFYNPSTGDLRITGEIDTDPLAITPGLLIEATTPGVLDITVNDTLVLDDFEIAGGINIFVNSPGDDIITLDLSGGIFGDLVIDMGASDGSLFGGDTVDLNAFFAIGTVGSILGDMRLTGVNTLLAEASIGGDVIHNNSRANVAANISVFSGSIGGNYTYYGGNEFFVESVSFLPGLIVPTTSIGGNMTLRMGNGFTGDLNIGGTVVGGNLTYIGGSGIDDIDLAGDAVIAGNVIANLDVSVGGFGVSTNEFTLANGGTIGGNLIVSSGLADDTVIVEQLPIALITDPVTTVGGNIMLNLGDGLNNVDLGGTIGGRSVSIITGLDNDIVRYAMIGSNVRLYSQLSLGDDMFTLDQAEVLGGTANPTLGYLYIDFGFGSDTFINNFVGPFTFPAYLRNLP